MSSFCDQRQSANVAIWRLGHVVCFKDVYYPILRHIVANTGDNLNRRPVFGKQTRKWQKNRKKNVIFSFYKRVKSILGKIMAVWLLPASPSMMYDNGK